MTQQFTAGFKVEGEHVNHLTTAATARPCPNVNYVHKQVDFGISKAIRCPSEGLMPAALKKWQKFWRLFVTEVKPWMIWSYSNLWAVLFSFTVGLFCLLSCFLSQWNNKYCIQLNCLNPKSIDNVLGIGTRIRWTNVWGTFVCCHRHTGDYLLCIYWFCKVFKAILHQTFSLMN